MCVIFQCKTKTTVNILVTASHACNANFEIMSQNITTIAKLTVSDSRLGLCLEIPGYIQMFVYTFRFPNRQRPLFVELSGKSLRS